MKKLEQSSEALPKESNPTARETGPEPLRGSGVSAADSPSEGMKEESRFDHDGYAGKTAQDFPPLPADGSKVQFHEDGCAWKTKDGSVTVETRLGAPVERKGFEGYLTAGAAMGVKAYERAHAQG